MSILQLQLLNSPRDDDQLFTKPHPMGVEFEMLPPKSDSYINLYDDGQDVPLGGSAHSLRNLLSSTSSTGGRDSPPCMGLEQRSLAPDALYSPVGHAATNNIGFRTQDITRNNADLRYCSVQADGILPGSSGPSVLANDAKYPTAQALPPGISIPASANALHKATTAGRTVSPTSDVECKVTAPASGSVTTQGIIAGPVRRPMSFVKALELSDKLAATEDRLQHQRRRGGAASGGGSAAGMLHQPTLTEGSDEDCEIDGPEHGDIERRQFGSSYEIAV